MEDDRDFQFSKLTPENIVINYILNMESGDFGILDEVKSALHQQIAIELIRAGQGKLLANNLGKFKNLDRRQIVESVIEAGDKFLAKEIAKESVDFDFEDIGKFIDKI